MANTTKTSKVVTTCTISCTISKEGIIELISDHLKINRVPNLVDTKVIGIEDQIEFVYTYGTLDNNKSYEDDKLHEMEKQIESILDSIPNAIRVREGGGYEDLAASLAVTLVKLGVIENEEASDKSSK